MINPWDITEHKLFEINEIKEESPFKYVLAIGPIDNMEYLLNRNQIIDNLESYCHPSDLVENIKNVLSIEDFVRYYVTYLDERVTMINYTSIPSSGDMELVVMARVDSNGISFVFSNNLEFLTSIKSK